MSSFGSLKKLALLKSGRVVADAIITKDPENVKEVFSFGYAKLFDQQ